MEAEGGDLGIEGEEDVGAAASAGETGATEAARQPEIAAVVAEKRVKKSKKAVVEAEEDQVAVDTAMEDGTGLVVEQVQKKKGRREKKEEKRSAAANPVARVVPDKVAGGWAGDDEFFA